MNTPIIFFNIGWMDFYKGPSNDEIVGGGSFITEHGYGHEIFNFKEHDGHYYGFVQTNSTPGTIKLQRLDAPRKLYLDNVTVVWTASHPDKIGTYIIGWYRNATLYRNIQDAPKKSGRKFNREKFGYFAVTEIENAKLLPHDERLFEIPRRKKNYLGQSNVWYAENVPDFIVSVKKYISKRVLPESKTKTDGKPRQNDSSKRRKVEDEAVRLVTEYFEKLGYIVESVEKDNVGWDLTATRNRIHLKLEVKGLSGSNISTELTPNEYKHLRKDKKNYRICIVTKALKKKAKLRIFRYSNESKQWISSEGEILIFEEVKSARVHV
ncbi:protein NO VEIN domain-containing protein [uncultured Draconibacterium sp.]|uniref:protein NO VEIN domain-containing protein n=1 Tax=uncultured Draconibacterium sp. TaxID=1573823 RepID=UPI002AA73239|nr:DUF3883 domain-containing protein [uncultured Draconibacterium sp.]